MTTVSFRKDDGSDEYLVNEDGILYIRIGSKKAGMKIRFDKWEGRTEPLRAFQHYVCFEKPRRDIPPLKLEEILAPGVSLMPHQLEAVNTILYKHDGRSILGLPPGEGKTITALVAAMFYGGQVLVACPAFKRNDWVKDPKRFVGKDFQIIKSTATVPDKLTGNYVISIDLGKTNEKILNHPWNVIIIDEAHRLKGKDTIASSAWIPAMHRARAVLLLTGTPYVIRPSDLFNYLHALKPKIFVDRHAFVSRYSGFFLAKDGKTLIENKRPSQKMATELSLVLERFMVRTKRQSSGALTLNTKILCKTFPPSVVIPTKRKEGLSDFERRNEPMKVWRETNALKQKMFYEPVLQAIREQDRGQSTMVFFHHKEHGKAYSNYLNQHKVEHCYVDGTTKPEKRQEILEPVRLGVMKCGIATLKSCNEGIDLIPGVTHVILMELPFDPATIEQAIARALRIGQNSQVTLTICIAKDSYDELLFSELRKTRNIIFRVVDGK